MAETEHIPIEKKAKGKSSIFKFVTLRNPEAVSSANNQRKFIYHPDTTLSHFIKGKDPNKKIKYEDLIKDVDTFPNPIVSADDVKKINTPLYDFADWLFRNRTSLTKGSTEAIIDDLSAEKLNSTEYLTIWDNLFYYSIKNSEPYIREALLMLIVANNYLNKRQDSQLFIDDTDFRNLASAKVVIPKIILSRSKKPIDTSNYSQGSLSTIDSESIKKSLTHYKIAIEELLEVNRQHIKNLANVDPSQIQIDENTVADGTLASMPIVKFENIKALVPNPLETTNLNGNVSATTISIVETLDLSDLYNPKEAIIAIEKKAKKLNQELFSTLDLSKKRVVSGSNIFGKQNDQNASNSNTFNPSEGCFPTIINENGITTLDAIELISSSVSGLGNATGNSENILTNDGHATFHARKEPRINTYFYVGLSLNTDNTNNGSPIKYSVKIANTNSIDGFSISATPCINGVGIEGVFSCKPGDYFRVAREDTGGTPKIRWYRFRPVIGLLTLMAEKDEESDTLGNPLVFDLSFSSASQGIYQARIFPCDNSSENDDDSKCSGITNLGVSDYMRVEQEVCCYTAGEVSHIENILQGEYKERSTRRLRRQETTTTFETEETTEKLRDTTTTDRYEMEQESSQVIQQDSALEIGVTLSTSYGTTNLTTDSGFASATSTQEANVQAVNYAKEVSNRALERIVKRVREERVNKVIEEFEENNIHGLDNSKNPDGHVVGLYRWVDKIYKNQVVNYGKRLSFEFMIPEPAKFHLWAMAKGDGIDLDEPMDPREDGLEDHTFLNVGNYAYWAAFFGVKVDAPPTLLKTISKAYNKTSEGGEDHPGPHSMSNNDLNIPEGYMATSGHIVMQAVGSTLWQIKVSLGSETRQSWIDAQGTVHGVEFWNNTYDFELPISEGAVPFALVTFNMHVASCNVTINCEMKPETMDAWQMEAFNKIINAYKEQKAAYDAAVAEAKAQQSLGIQIQGNNPLFNRTIEQQELKKHCLKWLDVKYGTVNHYNLSDECPESLEMPSLNAGQDSACYAKDAKFFEQAFDWKIMSYLFYPYFWGNQCSWKDLYKLDDNDPVFRGFLQAGMARVVVPVKPNYEKAIMYYLESGEVWNGGEVPVPGDPLYESIVDDLILLEPTPVGDPWETRLPTSLNIVQEDTAGVAGDGLPCYCDNYEADGKGGSTMIGGDDEGTTE